MKNILFISDVFLGGGLETRIIEQTKALKKYKIKSFLLCREINNTYSHNFIATSDALTILPSKQNLEAQFVLQDVDTICNFCTENNIDYIDCHPFWCALPAVLAANRLHIPISFSLHGVLSANCIVDEYLTAKALYDVIFSYGFNQIFAVAEYLKGIYPYLLDIEIVRNGIPLNNFTPKSFKNTKKIAIASRLDEPKTKLIIDFLPTLYASKAITQIDIYGDGSHSPNLQSFINTSQMSDKINMCGWSHDFIKTINDNQYMLVFGMGRVVLEAMRAGVPVGVLGYGGFAGFVNRDNLLDFSKNNLTSWCESPKSLSTEFKNLFKNPKNYLFTSNQLSIFNTELIWQKYYNIIRELSHQNNPIIQTIYNWLLDHPNSNLLNDQELFLQCVRLLSDGNHPINPRLFYSIFQKQFDEIDTLKHENETLKAENQKYQQQLYNRIRRKVSHTISKNRK